MNSPTTHRSSRTTSSISTGVLELVAFIEDDFGIAMADADIVPQNLDSLARISAFIEAKGAVPVSA